jgi:DoxX-like family
MPTLLRVNSFVFSIQKSKANYMNDKTKNVLKWLPSFIIACQLSVSAILKFTGFPFLVQSFSEIGLAEYLKVFGCAELLLASLFLYPRTMRIGFLLLTAYLGGAIAVEISHGTFIVPFLILTLIWIAAYLRNPAIFREKQNKPEKVTSAKNYSAA